MSSLRLHARALLAGAILASLGCRRDRSRDIGPAPDRVRAPAPTATASNEPPRVDFLIGWAGEDVTVDALLVDPARLDHVLRAPAGKTAITVTLAALGSSKPSPTGGEVVAYVPAVPPCPRVHMIGRAIVVAGTMHKSKAAYAEVSLDVASWRCL